MSGAEEAEGSSRQATERVERERERGVSRFVCPQTGRADAGHKVVHKHTALDLSEVLT